MGSHNLKVCLKRLYETKKIFLKMFKLFIILLGQAALLKSFPTHENNQLIKSNDVSFTQNFGLTDDEFEEKRDEFTKGKVRKPRSTDFDQIGEILRAKNKSGKNRHRKKGRKHKKNKRNKKRKHKKNKSHDERRYKKRDLKGRKKKHSKRDRINHDKELLLIEVLDKVELRPSRKQKSENFDEQRKNYWKYQNRNTRNLGGKSKSNSEDTNKYDIDSAFYQDDKIDSKPESKCIFYDSISGRCLQEIANHGCLYGDPEDGGLFGCDD